MTGRGKDIGNHLRNKLIRGHTRSAVMDSLGLLIRRVVGSTPTGPPACRRHRDHEASQRARSQPARMARIPRISLETKAEAAATSEMTLATLDQGLVATGQVRDPSDVVAGAAGTAALPGHAAAAFTHPGLLRRRVA